MNIGFIIKLLQLSIILAHELRLLTENQQPLPFKPIASLPPPPPIKTIELEPIRKASSMLEFQITIEQLFHKNQLFTRIRNDFMECTDPVFADMMDKAGFDQEFGFDFLVQLALHKRATLPTMAGILMRHFNDDCQRTANALDAAVRADLGNWSPLQKVFIVRWDISQDVQDDIDRYQYPLPMVVEPRILRNNKDTGYYTSHNSVILRHNHHDEDVCLDHLNSINRIKFRINQQVATTIKNRWRNLDKPKPDEEPGEYQKRVKVFEKYDRTAHDVLNHLGLSNEGEFWLTHKYDKRGRTYCQGYHVNYQAACWNKAVVEFANQEITEE
jgi:hypothetical protein